MVECKDFHNLIYAIDNLICKIVNLFHDSDVVIDDHFCNVCTFSERQTWSMISDTSTLKNYFTADSEYPVKI